MYQILLWGIALFMTAVIFITTFTGISEMTDKRMIKQTVNLAGKEIVNHLYMDGGTLHIQERCFVKAVSEQIPNDGFIGCIFVYDTYATALDFSGEEAVPVFFSEKNEKKISEEINILLRSLLPEDGQQIGIRFQYNSQNRDVDRFFSNLKERPTIFLVLRGKKYYTVSGYSLKLAGS